MPNTEVRSMSRPGSRDPLFFRPLWIEVDDSALRRNLKHIRRHVGTRVKILATVKQEAYGHGLIPAARAFAAAGADLFGVGSLEEAIQLRKAGIKKEILLLSLLLPKYASYCLEYRVIPAVAGLALVRQLQKAAEKRACTVPVHLKIDTGMGRLGPYRRQAAELAEEIRSRYPRLEIDGVFTHFPVADTDPEFTRAQIEAFRGFVAQLRTAGVPVRLVHCANSAATLLFADSHFSLVRPGLALYGVQPASNTEFPLSPALSLKSRVIYRKIVPRGGSVSYGRTFRAKSSTRIATVAAGYADGYPWSASNRAQVIFKNCLCPQTGRVCMDHFMFRLPRGQDARIGDEVILLGKSSRRRVSAEQLAHWAGTIPYEILTRLSDRIPRIYRGNTKSR
ncbi:MAG: alanine racemase [Candidatus Omnitrophica bacterium]|nr:alanine racemase [Candidatus Omnitrophota bacterium]